MAWPPGVLPVNRTDSLNQQANHPNDHNAVNQAVNDIVARFGLGPTYAAQTGGATGPILANSVYQPFTFTVPGVAWNRLVVVEFQYYLVTAEGGTASVELHHGGTTDILSEVQKGAGVGSVAGHYVTPVSAGAAFPMYLLIRAIDAQTDVYADGHTNRISVVGYLTP